MCSSRWGKIVGVMWKRNEREKEREYRNFLHFGPTVQADFAGGSTLAVTPLPLRPSSKYIQSVLAGEWGTLPYRRPSSLAN